MRADLPADLQQVPEALGRDQRHLAAPALEQRIGGDRGAVGKAGDLAQRDPAGVRHLPEAVENGAARVVGRRGPLEDMRLAGAVVDGGEVGEGAAHIHPDDPGPGLKPVHGSTPLMQLPPAARSARRSRPVMPGLVPGIRFRRRDSPEGDARNKSGHDDMRA